MMHVSLTGVIVSSGRWVSLQSLCLRLGAVRAAEISHGARGEDFFVLVSWPCNHLLICH